MISEDGRDLIADAVEQRKIELEREILTTPYERYAEIASDIEACSSAPSPLALRPQWRPSRRWRRTQSRPIRFSASLRR
jgi:hypothetical protein